MLIQKNFQTISKYLYSNYNYVRNMLLSEIGKKDTNKTFNKAY